MNVFISLVGTTAHSHTFEATDDGPSFTAIRIREGDSLATLSVNADSTAIALQLADALRAAALKHMPAQEPATEVPA